MPTRRALLGSAFVVSAGALAGARLWRTAHGDAHVSVRLSTEPAVPVADNFIGLGYEMSSAAQLGLLSAQDSKYLQLVRNLGPAGMFRFGGIVADFTAYAPDRPVRTAPHDTLITRRSLEQLRGFLDATGWTALYSLNFGRGTLDEAVGEATAVENILGPKLAAIELGNEVDNYGRGDPPLRQPPWGFQDYLAQYRIWRRAILATVPGLKFAAPDTAESVAWVQSMAEQARDDVQLLTTHFYLNEQRHATLAQLIQPDSRLIEKLEKLRQISLTSGLPWRMCETNSFSGGGHPGLSDTFAAALWTLNHLLLLAQHGCAGVNLETGVNQLGFQSFYSPIRTTADGAVEVGAPYYGLLAFAAAGAAGADLHPVEMTGSAARLSVYAISARGRLRSLVVLNWDTITQASVSLAGSNLRSADVLRLTAPDMTSRDGILFGGGAVDAMGHWTPKDQESLESESILVAPASAVVLKVRDGQE